MDLRALIAQCPGFNFDIYWSTEQPEVSAVYLTKVATCGHRIIATLKDEAQATSLPDKLRYLEANCERCSKAAPTQENE